MKTIIGGSNLSEVIRQNVLKIGLRRVSGADFSNKVSENLQKRLILRHALARSIFCLIAGAFVSQLLYRWLVITWELPVLGSWIGCLITTIGSFSGNPRTRLAFGAGAFLPFAPVGVASGIIVYAIGFKIKVDHVVLRILAAVVFAIAGMCWTALWNYDIPLSVVFPQTTAAAVILFKERYKMINWLSGSSGDTRGIG